jgi:hypothetical protein
VLDRIWYRRIRMKPPWSVSRAWPPSARWVRLLPYRWRRFHHSYAVENGFFWLPCPLCGREFGGHETSKTVPDRTDAGLSHLVCTPCARSLPYEHPEEP